MKILFAFENCLPSAEADAEVFVATAHGIAPLVAQAWLHVPMRNAGDAGPIAAAAGMPVIRGLAPVRPGALRHFCCGLTLVWRTAFRQADAVYTRNLWIAWIALRFGQRVIFDHYRPWPDQIPPLQWSIHRLMSHRRFLINICHSEYTRAKYVALGVPGEKLACVHNGHAPERLQPWLDQAGAKAGLGLPADRKAVVYTGRLNHKKGLDLVIAAARRLPDLLFVLVGSYGPGSVEAAAAGIANILIVRWQDQASLRPYIYAADVLLIPPSSAPLAEFGSTVLPLKLFVYLASGRPILAGDTPDVREVLTDGVNAVLCRADDTDALVAGLARLTGDEVLAARLGATAAREQAGLTWEARARTIVGLVEARLAAAPGARGRWSLSRYSAWLALSWRWLGHLLRHGSWVLPPRDGLFSGRTP